MLTQMKYSFGGLTFNEIRRYLKDFQRGNNSEREENIDVLVSFTS